jgi:hypothetical protein
VTLELSHGLGNTSSVSSMSSATTLDSYFLCPDIFFDPQNIPGLSIGSLSHDLDAYIQHHCICHQLQEDHHQLAAHGTAP